jgi:quercetin dioxygenase-like cupin family protein
MKVLAETPAPRPDRPASAVIHDEPNARVVAFHLLPGQRVPEHNSDSTVTVHVVSGSGTFEGTDASVTLKAGEAAVYAPGEMHAMEAGAEPLHFLAVIAPRPGG